MIENHMVQGDPEAGTYDPEPYRERALDDVIETIMLFGQWPQPRPWRGGTVRRVEFDLCDWIADNLEPSELAAFAVGQICGEDTASGRLHLERDITEQLRAELSDSEMVNDHIDELHRDETEDQA